MENNKEKINTKKNNSHEAMAPIIFGILAVVIMTIAAHFLGS